MPPFQTLNRRGLLLYQAFTLEDMALTCQYEVFKISTRPDRQFTQGRSKIGKLAQEGGEQFDKIIEKF